MGDVAHEGNVAVLREAVRDFEDGQERLLRAEARFEVGAVDSGEALGRTVAGALRDAGGSLRTVYAPLRDVRVRDDEDVQDTLRWVVVELTGLRSALLGAADSLSAVSPEKLADAQLVLRRVRLTVGPHYRALRWVLTRVEGAAREKAHAGSARTARALKKAPPGQAGGGVTSEVSTEPQPAAETETLEAFAQRLVASCTALAGTEAFFGDDRCFVSHAFRAMGADSIEHFKARLLAANQKRLISLARADMVELMDPAVVRESEIRYLGATFHMIALPEAPPESIALAGFAKTTLHYARGLLGGPGAFGRRKVFISALWEALPGHYRRWNLENFKRRLFEASRARYLTLARADLVSQMDATLVRESEAVQHGNTVHFVVVDGGGE